MYVHIYAHINRFITITSLTDASLNVKDSVQQKIVLAGNGDLEVDIIGVCNQERPKVEEIDDDEELEVHIYFCRYIYMNTCFCIPLFTYVCVYIFMYVYIVYIYVNLYAYLCA
jgi:hypothetical protein